MKTRARLLSAGGLLLLWALWLAWLWQPEHQLRLHQEHLLKRVASRNWNAVAPLLTDDYSDRWGGSKAESLALGREAFRQFIVLSVQGEMLELSAPEGRVVELVRLSGSGGPFADFIAGRVNALGAPFVFTWVHRSGQPWDWQLRRVEQPELEIEPGL